MRTTAITAISTLTSTATGPILQLLVRTPSVRCLGNYYYYDQCNDGVHVLAPTLLMLQKAAFHASLAFAKVLARLQAMLWTTTITTTTRNTKCSVAAARNDGARSSAILRRQ